jgi:hypothetical protein
MKKFIINFRESIGYVPEHPERTAKRSLGWDFQYQVWTNRVSMARSIRMQQRGTHTPWTPIVPLSNGEGY